MKNFNEKRRAAMDQMLRDSVYEAAVEILTTDGYSALTMDLLAKKVGISRPTLYNHFADKDHVLISVEDRLIAPIREKIQQTLADEDLSPDRGLAEIMRICLESVFANRALFESLFRKDETEGPRFENKVSCRAQILRDIQSFVDKGIASGLFKDQSSDIVSEMLLGAIMSFVETMIYDGIQRQSDEVQQVFEEVILAGLFKR